MLQNKNSCQWRTPRRRIHRLPMPRRPIHPHLEFVFPSDRKSTWVCASCSRSSVILSGVIGPRSGASRSRRTPIPSPAPAAPQGVSTSDRLISPHNNPIITQNLNLLPRRPQPRSRTLPRPRMPHKQIPHPIPPNNPAPMQLNPLLLRKPMHNQQFIQGILQGIWPVGDMPQNIPRSSVGAFAKTAIDKQSFVRPASATDRRSRTEAALADIGAKWSRNRKAFVQALEQVPRPTPPGGQCQTLRSPREIAHALSQRSHRCRGCQQSAQRHRRCTTGHVARSGPRQVARPIPFRGLPSFPSRI